VIYDNGLAGGAGGIHLVDEPGCGLPTDDAVVVNNTIVEPRIAGIRMNDGASGNVVFNNLVVSGNPIADEEDANLVDPASNLTRGSSAGLFVDADAHDYRLAPGSDALDAGRASYQGANAPGADVEGAPRPGGPAFDAGAYEGAVVVAAGGAPRAETVRLHPPAPNPSGTHSTLRYALPRAAHVTLRVFDAQGREVLRLVDAPQPAGVHVVTLDGAALPSGVYLVRLTAGDAVRTQALVRRG